MQVDLSFFSDDALWSWCLRQRTSERASRRLGRLFPNTNVSPPPAFLLCSHIHSFQHLLGRGTSASKLMGFGEGYACVLTERVCENTDQCDIDSPWGIFRSVDFENIRPSQWRPWWIGVEGEAPLCPRCDHTRQSHKVTRPWRAGSRAWEVVGVDMGKSEHAG